MFSLNNIHHRIKETKNTICELRNENNKGFAVKLKYNDVNWDRKEVDLFIHLRDNCPENKYIIKYYDHKIENNAKELLRKWAQKDFENPKTCVSLELDLCQMSLEEWHQRFRSTSIFEKLINIFTQLVIGVAFLHNNKIIHRNIEPTSILISLSNDGRNVRVKIGGFGSAKVMEENNSMEVEYEHSITPSDLLYWSPEFMEKKFYNQSVDIYPLGLIYVDLLYERSFQINSDMKISLFNRIKLKHNIEEFVGTLIDEKQLTLIRSIVEVDTVERLDADEILHYLLPYNKNELVGENVNLIEDIATQLNTGIVLKKDRN